MISKNKVSSDALIQELELWLQAKEGEHFEFKEAKNTFHFGDLLKYCCALSNEGGGKMILGVSDKRPRKIVGSNAFLQPEDTRRSLMEKLHLVVDFEVIHHPNGRVLVFEVPSRPVGTAIRCDGVYWSREGDSLVHMSDAKLRNVFAEAGHDYSADICRDATMRNLDSDAIEDFRHRWIEKSKNHGLVSLSQEQLLCDAEVVLDGEITYAALVLFGTRQALGRYLGQSEIVFEYRSSEASGPAQQRLEYRQGFFSYYDELWNTINLRNDLQHYQNGLFVLDIPTFAERSFREAILNAVSHRDYQLGGNVFVRQYARRLTIESPGGFPAGITLDNILDRQLPRNRRIADVFAKCGLVERSGQGMNLMFEQSIQQGKRRPDFTGTDAYNVVLTLHGEVQYTGFVQFLEKIGSEKVASFGTHDFLVLDFVRREEPVPPDLQPRLRNLVDLGVIESIGRGRGTQYMLSRRYYATIQRKGAYTRRRGLDRETNKHLLLKHIKDNAQEGSKMDDFRQVLPGHSRSQIQVLLRELKKDAKVFSVGRTRSALWYPLNPHAEPDNSKDKLQ
ncbi:MAG: putative DNA binding domain-containing protein [Proteobacteria bacterium]|nr:putative DNA binding domain-containing protein [Pseudomonadota bacterium]